MTDDDRRSADTLAEIRDLLIEMRDFEKERAVEVKKQFEESRHLQAEWSKRQKNILRFAGILLVLLVPLLIWLFWLLGSL